MKTILITGVTTGIGKSIVQQLSQREDTSVIALTKHAANDLPKNVEIHQIDLTDYKQVEKLIDQIQKKHPVIDVLINNAGNGWRGMIEDTTISEAKQQLELNVWGLVHLTQCVLPSMRKRKNGHIINISSVAASINYGTIGYYSATKAFIEKVSEVLALEIAPWNITVSVVAPGAVKTKFGHNMINIQQYDKGAYKHSYEQWAKKFEIMFQKPLSSDVAAAKILQLIEKPKSYAYLTKRDGFYCYLKKLLPRNLFNTVFLRRYMNL